MKRIIVLCLSLISTMLFASENGCKSLGIQIVNNSDHTCVFKNRLSNYGTLDVHDIPKVIPSDTSSPIFYAYQDDVGVGIVLTYYCDKEMVKFYSWQTHCSGWSGTGEVGGKPIETTGVNLSYQAKKGSYFLSQPGQVTWYITRTAEMTHK